MIASPILPAANGGRKMIFPLTGLTTVAASPCFKLVKPGEAPFRQLAPHNLPCRERFAERFQRGRLRTSEDVFLKTLTALTGIRLAQGEHGHRG